MDLNAFSFTNEAQDDLDLDIEETIRQQMLALEEIDTMNSAEDDMMELESGFLKELEYKEEEKDEVVEEILLESLGSWQDLMRTITVTDIEHNRSRIRSEPSLVEYMIQNGLMLDSIVESVHDAGQLEQKMVESASIESERNQTVDADKAEIKENSEDTPINEKAGLPENTEKSEQTEKPRSKSLSMTKKKAAGRYSVGNSLHTLSKKNNIDEEDHEMGSMPTTEVYMAKTKTVEMGSATRIQPDRARKSLSHLELRHLPEHQLRKMSQKERAEYKGSVVSIDFEGEMKLVVSRELGSKTEIQANTSSNQNKEVDGNGGLNAVQPHRSAFDLLQNESEIEFLHLVNSDSTFLQTNEPIELIPSRETDLGQNSQNNYSDDSKHIAIGNNNSDDLNVSNFESEALLKQKMMTTESLESITDLSPLKKEVEESRQIQDEFGAKISKIDALEQREEEVLKDIKRQFQESRRSLLLVRERVDEKESPPRELKKAAVDKEKILKNAQDILASSVDDYELVRNAIISEAEIQKDLQMQLENTKNRRLMIKGELRSEKLYLMKQIEKIGAIAEWIMKYAIEVHTKEKDRANSLLQRAAKYRLLLQKKQINSKNTQKAYMTKVSKEKGKLLDVLQRIRAETEALEIENHKKAAELEALRLENERLTEIKLSKIESRLSKERDIILEETKAIKKALKASDQKDADAFDVSDQKEVSDHNDDFDVSDLSEVKELSFMNAGLQKIPHLLRDATNLKYLNLSRNQIKVIESLDYTGSLLFLNLDENRIVDLNLRSLSSPQWISATNNQIISISNIPESVKYLDLRGNVSVDAESLSSVTGLFICILKNTKVIDIAKLRKCISLLYADLENCSLEGKSLDFLESCSNLVYLNISRNLYFKVPSLPIKMLRELDLSYNFIPFFQLNSHLPMLKVLRLVGCKIQSIEPLWACPFLERIYLEDNDINDFNCLAALAPCQDLNIINLLGNGVCKDHRLKSFLYLIFRKINFEELSATDSNILLKPLKVIGLLNIVSRFLLKNVMYHEENVSLKVSNFQTYIDGFKFTEAKMMRIMGSYDEPFLNYILGHFRDGTMKTSTFESEQRYLSTVGSSISDLQISVKKFQANEISDGCILFIVAKIKNDIYANSIVYIQARIRMRRELKRYLVIRRAVITIQKAWRDCIKFRRLGRKLKARHRQQALQNKSALKIQATWKGYSVRKSCRIKSDSPDSSKGNINQENVIRPMTPSPGPSKTIDDLDDAIIETENLDLWLNNVNENEFDEKMNTYLSSEKLLHFENNHRGGQVAVNLERIKKYGNSYDNPRVPIRHPYHPVEIIRLGIGRAIPTALGKASFSLPHDITITRESEISPLPEINRGPDTKRTLDNEEISGRETMNEMDFIKRLYDSFQRKGLLEQTLEAKQAATFLNEGMHSKAETNQDRPNPFKSRSSSGIPRLDPISDQRMAPDSQVVYAWDPDNMSLSSKHRLEQLNPINMSHDLQLNLDIKPKAATPLKHTRIPLINNYLFSKMFGNKSQKSQERQKN